MMDNLDLFHEWDSRKEPEYPKCHACGEEIVSDYCYIYEDEVYCCYCCAHGKTPAEYDDMTMALTENFMED